MRCGPAEINQASEVLGGPNNVVQSPATGRWQKLQPAYRGIIVGEASLVIAILLDRLLGHPTAAQSFYVVPVLAATWMGSISSGYVTWLFTLSGLVASEFFHGPVDASWALNLGVSAPFLWLLMRWVAHTKRKVQTLQYSAAHDALTGVSNRLALLEYLSEQIPASAQARQPVTLALVDCDNFKQINDRFGHAAGDRALVALAKALRRATGPSGFVARTGGDEFVAVFVGCLVDEAELRLIEAADEYRNTLRAVVPRASFSFGVVPVESDTKVATVIELADTAMYERKRGRALRSGRRPTPVQHQFKLV